MVEAKFQIMKRGLKQKQVARALRVSEQFVGQCLNGQRVLPKRHALKAKKRFGVPIESWYTRAA